MIVALLSVPAPRAVRAPLPQGERTRSRRVCGPCRLTMEDPSVLRRVRPQGPPILRATAAGTPHQASSREELRSEPSDGRNDERTIEELVAALATGLRDEQTAVARGSMEEA